MGYFANGTEGMAYEAKWCDRCVHQAKGCQVWLLHLLHSYADCNKPESYLHSLIPMRGRGNGKCTMFHPKKAEEVPEPEEDPRQEKLF